MADVVTGARVLANNGREVMIYGNLYPIAGPVEETLQQAPVVLREVDFGNLRGGMGLLRYTDFANQRDRYSFGSTLDGITPGGSCPPPPFTTVTMPETSPAHEISYLGSTAIVVFSNAKLYNFDGSSFSASIDTLPGAPRSWCQFNSRVFHFLAANGYSYQTAAANVATDVATPTAQDGVVWDNKLWVIDTSGILYSSTTGNAASWTTKAAIPISRLTDIDLVVFDDLHGDATIWALTPFGPWIYDSVNDTWIQSRYQFPEYYRNTAKKGMGIVYRDMLLVRSRDRRLAGLTAGDGVLQVQDVSPGGEDDMLLAQQLGNAPEIQAFASDSYFVFASVGPSISNSGGYPSIYFAMPRQDGSLAWHVLAKTAKTTSPPSAAIMRCLTVVPTSTTNRLYFDDHNGSNYQLCYLNLDDLMVNPLTSTTRQYASDAVGFLPWFDAGLPGQNKLAIKVRVKINGAPSSGSFAVYAITDDYTVGTVTINGVSYQGTTLATLNTNPVTGTSEAILYFGTNREGVSYKSIRFILSYIRGSSTVAPKLEYLRFEYAELPPVFRKFHIKLDLSKNYGGRTPKQMRDDLNTAMTTATLGTFAFKDTNIASDVSYLVKLSTPQLAREPGREDRGVIDLELIEVSPHP